jgi:cytochrome b
MSQHSPHDPLGPLLVSAGAFMLVLAIVGAVLAR